MKVNKQTQELVDIIIYNLEHDPQILQKKIKEALVLTVKTLSLHIEHDRNIEEMVFLYNHINRIITSRLKLCPFCQSSPMRLCGPVETIDDDCATVLCPNDECAIYDFKFPKNVWQLQGSN